MSEVMVHNLANDVRIKLEELARSHGRTLEDEIRDILSLAVSRDQRPIDASATDRLGTRIARRFAGIGLEEDIPELRGYLVTPPSFDP